MSDPDTAYPGSLPHRCVAETLQLLPERAVFWPRRAALFVADLHFGKEERFGRAGIPIPAGSSERDLARLSGLISRLSIERVYVLGDLMHARPHADESWLTGLSALLDRHPDVRMTVVAGNHDRHWSTAGVDARLDWHVEALRVGPFVLQHVPGDHADGFVLAGHLHPAWTVSARARGRIRLPAFWFRQGHAVLPAFSHFTGGGRISPTPGDRIFMTGPDFVMPVPHAALERNAATGPRSRRRTRPRQRPRAVDESNP